MEWNGKQIELWIIALTVEHVDCYSNFCKITDCTSAGMQTKNTHTEKEKRKIEKKQNWIYFIFYQKSFHDVYVLSS